MQAPSGYILIKEEDLLKMYDHIRQLSERIKELETRLNKNSSNSHKPPTSDGLKRTIQNNREKSDRKPGAQEGHEGKTLKMSDNPDAVIVHMVEGYCKCGKSLKHAELLHIQRRQEIDLVEVLTKTTEHRIEVKAFSCGEVHYGEDEKYIPIQYGSGIKAMAVYLNQYQFIPFARQQELFQDLFRVSISDGVLQLANEKCYTNLEEVEQVIKEKIKTSPVIHNDETGIRCEDKTGWIHNSSTEQYTFYRIHEKRGRVAIEEIGILPAYKGICVHDRYSSYDSDQYTFKHALCNAHLLRDLKGLVEEEDTPWAKKMVQFLKATNREKRYKITKRRQDEILKVYEKIVRKGLREEPPKPPPKEIKRGRQKRTKSSLLLEVFSNRSMDILRFVFNRLVPFDNNLAERDLRMVKLKQKISGCFRTQKGAQIFCRIRGYISTARKQKYSILEALQMAIDGAPIAF